MALVDKVLTKRMRFFPGLYKYYKMLGIFLENSLFKPFSCMGKKIGSWIFYWKIGHPRTLICIMDLFVCLNKFPANFQKKIPILSGWKIQLSNFPTDPCCPMSLFQGHFVWRIFTLEGPFSFRSYLYWKTVNLFFLTTLWVLKYLLIAF